MNTFVEDAAVDVKGNLYVLKLVQGKEGSTFLLSRYLPNGNLDEAFASKGHRLVKLPEADGVKLTNSKLAICPVTGDLIIGAARTFPAETIPLSSRSSTAEIGQLFTRQRLGDNRLLMLRLSADGKPRGDFGSGGMKEIKVSKDNNDRFYSLSVAGDGRLVMSWRGAESSKIIVRKGDGSKSANFDLGQEGFDTFPTNLSITDKGRLRGAGIALDNDSDPESARPVVFTGRRIQMVDRVYEEEGNRRAISTSLLSGRSMMIVVPGSQRDSLETIDLNHPDAEVKYTKPVPGMLVLDLARPTPAGKVVLLSVKPGTHSLIATEVNPKDGKTVRTRLVGELDPRGEILNPTCWDILSGI